MTFKIIGTRDASLNDLSTVTLAHLKTGEAAQIDGIEPGFPHSERFLELGFTAGASVEILRKAFLGDPIEIRVRGTRYALRKSDAVKIKIKKSR